MTGDVPRPENIEAAITPAIDSKELPKLVDSFYLPQEESDHLRDQLEVNLTPEQKTGFREVETAASQAFVDLYGHFLNEEQKSYLSSSRVIVSDVELGRKILEDVDATVREQNQDKVAVEGVLYKAYYVSGSNSPIEGLSGKSLHLAEGVGRQLWAGRIPVVPILDEDLRHIVIDKKWLMTERQFSDWQHEVNDFETAWEAIKPFVTTNTWAAVALHEKIHGSHKFDLPLPVMEAATNFYERETFRQSNWKTRNDPQFSGLTALWQEVVDEKGEDAHHYVFDTMEPQLAEEMHQYIMSKFTRERIEAASPELIWETETIAV